MKSIKSNRVYGLDILRAVAIIYVMLSHGYEYSGRIINIRHYSWLTIDGVGLFFVLSGFLIGGILIKTIAASRFTLRALFHFWLRRWFRTLPSYYAILVVLVGCYYIVHHQLPPRIGQYFSFTQCFAGPHPLFFGEAWSLAVEEWFYLLIPAGLLMVLSFAKNREKRILLWILFVLIAATLIRTYKVSQQDYFADGTFGLEIGKQVITRLDSIMYGMLGAWLAFFRPQLWLKHKNKLFVAGLFLLFGSRIAVTESLFFYGYFFYSIAAIGTLCLLPKLSTVKTGKGVWYKGFTFISMISYSMYLTNHMVVLRGIMPVLSKWLPLANTHSIMNASMALVLFWSLTILISWLLFRFWEQPIMKLRDKLTPGSRPGVLSAS